MTTRTAGSTSVNRGQQRQTTPIRCWETNVSCPARLLSAQLFSRREKRTSRSPATKIAARGSSRVFRSLVRKRGGNVAQLSVVDVFATRTFYSRPANDTTVSAIFLPRDTPANGRENALLEKSTRPNVSRYRSTVPPWRTRRNRLYRRNRRNPRSRGRSSSVIIFRLCNDARDPPRSKTNAQRTEESSFVFGLCLARLVDGRFRDENR